MNRDTGERRNVPGPLPEASRQARPRGTVDVSPALLSVAVVLLLSVAVFTIAQLVAVDDTAPSGPQPVLTPASGSTSVLDRPPVAPPLDVLLPPRPVPTSADEAVREREPAPHPESPPAKPDRVDVAPKQAGRSEQAPTRQQPRSRERMEREFGQAVCDRNGIPRQRCDEAIERQQARR